MEPTAAVLAFRNVGLAEEGMGLAFDESFADQDPATMVAAPVGIDDQEDVVMAEAVQWAATDAIPSQDGSSDVEVVAASFLGALSSQEEATRVAAELASAELPDVGGESAQSSPRLDITPLAIDSPPLRAAEHLPAASPAGEGAEFVETSEEGSRGDAGSQDAKRVRFDPFN